jgi:hypothetical protein
MLACHTLPAFPTHIFSINFPDFKSKRSKRYYPKPTCILCIAIGDPTMHDRPSRRSFLQQLSVGAGIAGLGRLAAAEPVIQGFDEMETNTQTGKTWQPVSDRKVRVGIVGYGVCRFGAAFGLQDHPNVEVVAVSDLFPDRCAELAKACRCEKTYPSLEEMVKDDRIEAIFLATDAPSHARHAILVLEHGTRGLWLARRRGCTL